MCVCACVCCRPIYSGCYYSSSTPFSRCRRTSPDLVRHKRLLFLLHHPSAVRVYRNIYFQNKPRPTQGRPQELRENLLPAGRLSVYLLMIHRGGERSRGLIFLTPRGKTNDSAGFAQTYHLSTFTAAYHVNIYYRMHRHRMHRRFVDWSFLLFFRRQVFHILWWAHV